MLVSESGRNEQSLFQFIWESGVRGEYFLEINQSETGIACDGHVIEDLPYMFLLSYGSFG
jgi:hypothetical protein